MSRFVKLDRLDPYRLFGSSLRRSRLGMRAAFDAAFASFKRCNDLLDAYHWGREELDNSRDVFEMLGVTNAASAQNASPSTLADLERIYADAQAEDLQADYQASIVLLFADDALYRFAKGALGRAPAFGAGYGHDYGTHRGKVPLTDLLRASTNAIRHV